MCVADTLYPATSQHEQWYNLRMPKARNGVRHSLEVKRQAARLRRKGKTNREIANLLHISLGTACLWLRKIKLTQLQRQAIADRRRRHTFTSEEKTHVIKRLRPFQYKTQYSDDDLLDKIRDFHSKNGRIPLKREFNALKIYRDRFGTWNNAIAKAGFEVNPVLFSKKFTANDGHTCDSFSEKVVDDWLYSKGIKHRRSVRYGKEKVNCDFVIEPNIMLEFFGLAGVQKKYDAIIQRKRKLSQMLGLKLIEIYPDDIYPKNKLPQLLHALMKP